MKRKLYVIFLAFALIAVGCERAKKAAQCRSNEECDDSNACSADLCVSSLCENTFFPDETDCNDSDLCTVNDTCQAGACGGQPKDCSALDRHCETGVCNLETGDCEPEAKPEGSTCDDGLTCTVDDACREGICTGTARACDDGDDCTADECNEGQDLCEHFLQPRPGTEGPALGDTCSNSLDDDCDGKTDGDDPNCQPCSQDEDCEDDNQCTTDNCVSDECQNVPVDDGTMCSDTRFCTVDDACSQGVCQGSPRDCSAAVDPCQYGICLEATDECGSEPRPEGADCEDGLYCTVGDTCQASVCIGSDRDCSDDDPCTEDTCDDDQDACLNTLTPELGAEGPEGDPTCSNGIDDDCDRLIDDEDPNCGQCVCDLGDQRPCYTGPDGTQDNCDCRPGIETCDDGCSYGPCVGEQIPQTEVCDGRDNDCDGQTDEGFEDLGDPCEAGLGICTRPGVMVCTLERDATFCSASAAPEESTEELCDNIDNDCDGSTDEDFEGVGDACSVGVGACRVDSVKVCGAFGIVLCDATAGQPTAETCDNLDNDCDGLTDEEYSLLGQPCSVGQGACLATGNLVCSVDGTTTECDATANTPSDEACDNLDNDCDGYTDEDWIENCSTACGEGYRFCFSGVPGPCSTEPAADDAACDNKDNDCDGETDEDVVGLGDPCESGIGMCLSRGFMVCGNQGQLICNAVPGFPQTEGANRTCEDLVDNDCDDYTDRSDPDCP